MTSNKGHNSVANLWRMTIYNLNVDLVYDNVYTKTGLNKSIRQDIKKDDFRCQARPVTLLQSCEK